MKEVTTIKGYPSNIEVFYYNDRTDENDCNNIDIDGKRGIYTREEWETLLNGMEFSDDSIERILNELEMHYNNMDEFFAKYYLYDTEAIDDTYSYYEIFDKLSDAQERMKEKYNKAISNDAVVKSELYERSAVIYLNDGNEIYFDIE